MTKFKLLFFILFFTNICISQSIGNSVTDIRTSKNDNKIRVVIENTNKTTFNVFYLKNPYRLVVDLDNTSTTIQAPSFKADDIIDTVRIGRISENKIRLVFDMTIPINIVKTFYLAPAESYKKHRIVIDFEFSKKDLENEDLIGKIIENNNLYDIDYSNGLNDLIDNILTENISDKEKETKILEKIQKNSATNKTIVNNKNKIISKTTKTNNKGKKPIIIIDAGHGGKDSGTIGTRGTKEKIITLAYAKSLKTALEKTNKFQVYLTRNQDFFIELHERVSIARRYKGDLFISIHADSSPNKKAKGTSIYTLSQSASDERTAQLAQKENKTDILSGMNLYGEYQDTINTLVDISRKQAMNESKKFAKILEREFLSSNVKPLGNMVKHANFAVLLSADMPSVLIEIGFLSNSSDEKMIRTNNYKSKIANSITNAIGKYFQKK